MDPTSLLLPRAMKPPPTNGAMPVILLLLLLLPIAVVGVGAQGKAANYLVFVDPPPAGVPCRSYHLGILTAALGSEAKAKAAIIYNYKNVVSGFSARVTPRELEAIKRQPHVNRALPSTTLHLMSTNFEDVS